MVEKIVNIDGKGVRFKASAAIPRLYRLKFRRDIFKDLTKLEKAYSDNSDNPEDNPEGGFEIDDLEIFENVAYIMAAHADENVPPTINEWLDQFGMFSIYEVLPEMLELWGSNLFTDVEAKKNSGKPTGN